MVCMVSWCVLCPGLRGCGISAAAGVWRWRWKLGSGKTSRSTERARDAGEMGIGAAVPRPFTSSDTLAVACQKVLEDCRREPTGEVHEGSSAFHAHKPPLLKGERPPGPRHHGALFVVRCGGTCDRRRRLHGGPEGDGMRVCRLRRRRLHAPPASSVSGAIAS